MGRLLKKEDLVPEIITSSTAIRAHATTKAVAKASGYKGEIILNKSLYAAGPEAYLNVMHHLSNEYVRALIIGHNPGLEELVEMLTGEIHLMPTCSLAHVKLRVDKWLEIDNKIKGKAEIWRPRDLT
jgi:phosphohistidine phosphatase